MALKGHTKIELQDVETGEVEVYEKDNTITPFLQECVNFLSDMGVTNMYQPAPTNAGILFNQSLWYELFGTLCLYPNRQDPDSCCKKGMELGWGRYNLNSNIGNANYQGLYNLEESVIDTTNKTATMVWDFSTSQAIGTIKSICLAPIRSFSQGNHGNIADNYYNNIASLLIHSHNISPSTYSSGHTIYTDVINYNTKPIVAMRAGNYMLMSNTYYVTLAHDIRNKERYVVSLTNNGDIQIHKEKSLQKSLFFNPNISYPEDLVLVKTISALAAEDEDVSSLYSTDGDTYTAKAYVSRNFMIQGLDMKNNTFDIVYELQVNRTGNVTATYYEYNVKTYNIKTGNLVREHRFLQSNDTISGRWWIYNTDKSTISTRAVLTHQFTWRGVMYWAYAYNKIKAYDMINNEILWDTTLPNGLYDSYAYSNPNSYSQRYNTVTLEFDDYEALLIGTANPYYGCRLNLLTGECSSLFTLAFKCSGSGYWDNGSAWDSIIRFMPRTLFLDYPHIFATEENQYGNVENYSTIGGDRYSIISFLPSRLFTVNNLQTDINKTNKKTMKISYTITEA